MADTRRPTRTDFHSRGRSKFSLANASQNADSIGCTQTSDTSVCTVSYGTDALRVAFEQTGANQGGDIFMHTFVVSSQALG